MFENKKIRSQMFFGIAMLFVIVAVLSASSFHGSMKFRKLIKSTRGQAYEMPLVAELSFKISQLRTTIGDIGNSTPREVYQSATDNLSLSKNLSIHQLPPNALMSIREDLMSVRNAFENYRFQLENAEKYHTLGNNSQELSFVKKFDKAINTIESATELTKGDWFFDGPRSVNDLKKSVDGLQVETRKLPEFLKQRLQDFAKSARKEYHFWMALYVVMLLATLALATILIQRFNQRIFRPLEILVNGSRIVARGRYNHRIDLDSNDEMAELAGALNAMTSNFQEIKADLNQQVRDRTREVVRIEKMASVGFLAAGVAHEINTPLASIAWSAESLESRIQDILDPEPNHESDHHAEIEDMKKYLRRIQDEAFRCKGITSALLDFSRMGDTKKQSVNLGEIIQTVIEMLRPLSKYRGRKIEFAGDPTLHALVNSQEIKQVALNLITNSLDSVAADGGHVKIRLESKDNNAVLVVSDNGCGMDSEVLQHLFEPFFTRRRDGQGTGLGLSITYQIIQEHGGQIIPYSAGTGKGSRFTITLPLENNEKSKSRKRIAA